MHSMPDFAIEARALRRTFGAQTAVAGISFAVRRGEIYGLLGRNGAGKTTTIRMLSGQIDPDSGEAQVAGYDVVRQRIALKRHIGVVFEEQNLYDRLSARNNLRLNCWLYNLPTKRIEEVLDLVQLRDRAKDPVSQFSNGMRQRLMIARALLHSPEVLFLDEPSRGLDPVAARDVRQAILHLSAAGTTVLLTTHLMEEADQLCARVAFLVQGELKAEGTPRALKLAHGTRSLQVTLGDESAPDHLREELLRLDDAADQARLARWLASGEVRALHTQEATLEEVFLAVAGVRPV